MFKFTEITCPEMEDPLEEMAAAKAAGKCGDCYVCCAGYHEQCRGKDFNWYKELEEMLRWYVEEDEINEGDPENEYWVDGKHKAMKLLGMEIEE